MAEYDKEIDELERSARKKWLIITVCFSYILPLLNMSVSYFPKVSKSEGVERFVYSMTPVIFGFIGMIFMWIIWHCIYKKYGTKLLTCWLVVSPLLVIWGLIMSFSVEWDAHAIITTVISWVIYPFWYGLSLKMRKINKAARKRKALQS